MLQRIYAAIIFSILSGSVAFSQGSITGTVKDSKTGEAVIGANVIIQGTTIGSPTDIEGKFLISNVKAGTYALQISSVTYKAHTVPDVVVEDAKRINIDVQISEDVSTLEEVVVTGTRQTDTDFELLRSIKESKLIVVGITAEQISRSLDRDAAQVLRRVPGITINDGQFVQIRGLAARYNPVLLHNAYAPSFETDVRSFSFATLPSSQLDRMLVYKSASADIPGDFAGGVVKVFTKSIPDENSFVIDYSTQIRSGTTFNDYYHQEKNPGHFTGFNTGYYDIPAGTPAIINASVSGDRLVTIGRSFKNSWVPQKSTAIPDQRFSLTFNRKFKIGKIDVGNISALNYSNTYAIFNVERNDYTEGGNIVQNYAYMDKQYNQQVRTGFLFNWAFKFNSANNIEFKNLYNQSSNDQYVDRTGTGDSEGQKNGGFDKTYRSIYSGQLLGTHNLFKGRTTFEWVAGYNNTKRDQPDYRRFRSQLDGLGGAQLTIVNTVTPESLGRFYSKLSEDAYSGGASIKHSFAFSDDPLKNPELKGGIFFENKTRSFKARSLGYTQSTTNFDYSLTSLPIDQLFQPSNFNNTTGIQISEISDAKNSYSASNNLLAYYLMGSVPIGDKLKIDAGARIEDNLQSIKSVKDTSQHIVRVLPSANLSYNFTEKMLVRAAYGETLNRPEFRELAPFSFYDFNYNFVFSGDPRLKTARIQNADLKWELYPNKGELITFGVFYKNFTNPIESFVSTNSGGGGVKDVNFQNAQSATSYGVELEIKKSLQGLTNSKILNDISVMLNGALIKSKVVLPANLRVGRENNRPMQGQAPYVLNGGIFYSNDASGLQINALYNVVGKNIVFVGNDNYKDVYLMPRSVIDLTFNKRLGERFNLKGGISDLLNQPMLFLQDGNGDKKFDRKNDQTIQSYKPGQVFSIGFSYRI